GAIQHPVPASEPTETFWQLLGVELNLDRGAVEFRHFFHHLEYTAHKKYLYMRTGVLGVLYQTGV
ncbi:MAG TPA: hypothetical protein DCZ10_12125, partial [Pelotomaculum sp.]|nr:hypothetical protein [Pelotomaculum sp.]